MTWGAWRAENSRLTSSLAVGVVEARVKETKRARKVKENFILVVEDGDVFRKKGCSADGLF